MKNENEYNKNEYNMLKFPDKIIFQRINDIVSGTNSELGKDFQEILDGKESKTISKFYEENLPDKGQTNPTKGAFYKCRQLGIITRYDKEVNEEFNFAAFSSLIFSIFAGKIISGGLLQGKYIKQKSETKWYLISTGTLLTLSGLVIYKKRKELDETLDQRYSKVFDLVNNKRF
jgi:hypothetical protein